MPDQEPVNISVLADELASTLRTMHDFLYDIQDTAGPVASVRERTRTLISGLRKKLNARELEIAAEEKQIQNSLNSLEKLFHCIKRLEKVSDDIAKKPSVHDLGILGTQWDECCEKLLTLIYPVSQTLDSLSDMAKEWPPVAVPAAGQVREGETNAGADARIRDRTSRNREAS
jgi:hypothetical protein